jgi:hypothetical protein
MRNLGFKTKLFFKIDLYQTPKIFLIKKILGVFFCGTLLTKT